MGRNLNEHIVIANYDSTWPEVFAKLAARAKQALGALAQRIEHVGSTAVPGLAAKPIIDLDAVVSSQQDLPEAIRRLATLSYVHEGTLGIAGREAFRWPPGESRHHLYVVTADSAELARHLAFRDALRSDLALREAYMALKRSLAERFAHDREAYNSGKAAFIESALAERGVQTSAR
jgi:GrpB-like predicted nucleotidyltransferase (UPF0157 family)